MLLALGLGLISLRLEMVLDLCVGENRASRLHLMQSMINMQSLIIGEEYGEYNNPRHR